MSSQTAPFRDVQLLHISEGGPETGLTKLDPMLRLLMVHHSVVNKFPKGFCIKIFFSHRKSHSELFRMLRMLRMVQNDFIMGLALAKVRCECF